MLALGLRWPPPGDLADDGQELIAPQQGLPLGIGTDPECVGGELRATAGAGMLLYTDGLTEARRDGKQFGLDSVSAALAGLERPSPAEAVGVLRSRVSEFAERELTDDLCLVAARLD